MFDELNVNVVDRVDNWEESIKIAAKPLLENGNIELRYIEKMIDKINEIGFYVVLDEYIAMPHSRPEDGVINTAVSFLKVNEAVKYGDEDIKLIFILAAKDSNSHIDIIQNLLEIFQNDEIKNALLASKTKEDILNVLQKNKNK